MCLCVEGFGMTTPATVEGKVFLMFYGLLGCAATILFFNLFLERVITIIAIVLKSCQERRYSKAVLPQNGRGAVERGAGASGGGRGEDLAGWKPSVYCVMLILGVAAVLVSCFASVMYSAAEGWGYLDSLYFCFVAFSTIGFGDMVSSQRVAYEGHTTAAYRLGNFLFILTGVCCIYSLFNVISIIIKQVLNWLLRRLTAPCRCCHHPHRHPRRNVVAPGHLRARRDPSIETDAVNDSETDAGRRMSGEMISMRDFLAANKVRDSVHFHLVMQSHGCLCAGHHAHAHSHTHMHSIKTALQWASHAVVSHTVGHTAGGHGEDAEQQMSRQSSGVIFIHL